MAEDLDNKKIPPRLREVLDLMMELWDGLDGELLDPTQLSGDLFDELHDELRQILADDDEA
jgi:hypothetical protein